MNDEVNDFPQKQAGIHTSAGHCNDMIMAAKKTQECSDHAFLTFHLKENPIESTMGVCFGVDGKTFTVFVPTKHKSGFAGA